MAFFVDFELEPSTSARDDLCRPGFFVGAWVKVVFDVGTRRTHQLRDDNALGSVDDESALVCHQRKVAHEHRLALDDAGFVVHVFRHDEKRGRIGEVFVFALFDRVLRGLEPVFFKRQRHGVVHVFDRADFGEHVFEPRSSGNLSVACGDARVDSVTPSVRAH